MPFYLVTASHHSDDIIHQHYCELDTESADILRDSLEERYVVSAVQPCTKKAWREGVPEI